jgi:Cu2+-exporting ATPase
MTDFNLFAKNNQLLLNVDNMHCAGCMSKIENALNSQPDISARVNLSTKRLTISWKGKQDANRLAQIVSDLGYNVKPYEVDEAEKTDQNELNFLLRCLGVSGLATVAIMVLADALWLGGMGTATKNTLQWLSALIAFPTIIYAGLPFYRSAYAALRKFKSNMDVPISLAVILAALMSFYETIHNGEHVYYDSSVMLLFFLLIGRYLDKKTRAKAKSSASGLLSMMSGTANILENGQQRSILISEVLPDMILSVASGEKFAADGILQGNAEIDSSAITGEFATQKLESGAKVFAGMINIGAPVLVKVTCAAENSLLSDIVKAMENAEQSKSQYVRIADKVARIYTPVVHILAILAFAFWMLNGLHWQGALMVATTVLIITCPCAMGLAVPVVQVIAITRLFKNSMLVKTGDALEKLANVKNIVFDKTGTLTLGKPVLNSSSNNLQMAASMAAKSNHPLSRAISAHYKGELLAIDVHEEKGKGLISGDYMLGSASFVGAPEATDSQMEIWFKSPSTLERFTFTDEIKPDAAEAIASLNGYNLYLLSGDREKPVAEMAQKLGIKNYKGHVTPIEKVEFVKQLGANTLMVGDGLNDAAALKTASVSISPSTAMDITQNAADVILQGEKLLPITDALKTARFASKLVRQNFYLAIGYNLIAVPVAFAGLATPLVAAIAMSSSSIIVVLNSLRISRWI